MVDMKNFKRVILKIAKLIKDFLFKPKSKEFFLYASFCGLATVFWFLLALNDNYKENFSVPIVLTNIPSHVMLTNTPDSTVSLRVTAKGSQIIGFKLRNLFKSEEAIPLRFDSLLLISHRGEIKLPTRTLSRYLQRQYNSAFDLEITRPDTLEYIYTEGAAKRVPIKLGGNLEAASQYFIEQIYLTPDSIDVYAPKDILKEIHYVNAVSQDISNIEANLQLNLQINPIKGAKFIPDTTMLRVDVDAITEKTVMVPLTGVGFPQNKSLLTFPSEVEVTFQVGTQLFNAFDSSDFAIELPYNELIKQKGNYPIKLTHYPDEIKHIRLSHQSVDFLIEKR